MLDRHYQTRGSEDWSLRARWLNPPATFDLKTPLDFVTTNDIIGGNSGSPMIDQAGRGVGLVFYSNIESPPGDFIYTTTTNPPVAVHSAAITEALRNIYRALRLVDEL